MMAMTTSNSISVKAGSILPHNLVLSIVSLGFIKSISFSPIHLLHALYLSCNLHLSFLPAIPIFSSHWISGPGHPPPGPSTTP